MKYYLFILALIFGFTNNAWAKDVNTSQSVEFTVSEAKPSSEASFYGAFMFYGIANNLKNLTNTQQLCFVDKELWSEESDLIDDILNKNFTKEEIMSLRNFYNADYSFFAIEFLKRGYTPNQALQALKDRKANDVFKNSFLMSENDIEEHYTKAISDLETVIASDVLNKANNLFSSTDNFSASEKQNFNNLIIDRKKRCGIQ